MNQSRILPFYMTYPLPMYYQEEDTVTRDLEYLQQMYPSEAKRYQKMIAETLNQLDYEGSCIYDEYPDRWQLYRITQMIMDKIKRTDDMQGGDSNDAESVQQEGNNTVERQWDRIEEFVQVLLYYEIYKKRHTNHNGILKF